MRTYYDSLLAGFVLGLSLGGLIAADSVLFTLLMALGLWGGLLWARSAWLDARAALARVKGGELGEGWDEPYAHRDPGNARPARTARKAKGER